MTQAPTANPLQPTEPDTGVMPVDGGAPTQVDAVPTGVQASATESSEPTAMEASGGRQASKPTVAPIASPRARVAVGNIAGILAAAGFFAACAVGLLTGQEAAAILTRAVVALFVCWFVGLLLGSGFRVLIEEHVAKHHAENPKPSVSSALQPHPGSGQKAA